MTGSSRAYKKTLRALTGVVVLALVATQSAHATFHFMQIEQVIGGVNGDVTAQAIQLRMRATGQNLVSQARLRAFNASGAGAVTILNITSNVNNSALGSRVLICSANFVAQTDPNTVPDFFMTNVIPEAYLAPGGFDQPRNRSMVFCSIVLETSMTARFAS